jgi:hypothetical protein
MKTSFLAAIVIGTCSCASFADVTTTPPKPGHVLSSSSANRDLAGERATAAEAFLAKDYSKAFRLTLPLAKICTGGTYPRA